jgi:mRNA interferase MazF
VVKEPLQPGFVILVDFGSTVGREQSGIRPGVVISSSSFHALMTDIALVVPCTRTNRGWDNHVELGGPTGLSDRTFAITQQPRVIDLERVLRVTGSVDQATLAEIAAWVKRWIYHLV